MNSFGEQETLFSSTMFPEPGFNGRIYSDTPSVERESSLPPAEFTLGDDHDTLPGDEWPRVVPETGRLLGIMRHIVTEPLDRPETLDEVDHN